MDALTGQGQYDVPLSTAATLTAAEHERKATRDICIRSQIPCGFCTAAGVKIETELPF